MKRLAIAACVVMILLSGCGSKLSDKFDNTTLTAAGENVVALFSAKEFEKLNGLVREDAKDALSAEVLSGAYDQVMGKAGNFAEFGKVKIVGYTDKQTAAEYAVVVQQVKYENKTAIYTMYFDINMELTGFYIK